MLIVAEPGGVQVQVALHLLASTTPSTNAMPTGTAATAQVTAATEAADASTRPILHAGYTHISPSLHQSRVCWPERQEG